jgi:hypothetical protein
MALEAAKKRWGAMELSVNDARTLRLAPLWVFSAVVGRHQRFHPLELEAFWRCCEGAALTAPTALAHDTLVSALCDRDQLLGEYAAETRPIASGLTSVAAIVNRLPAGDAEAIKDMLVTQIAEGVARARGPFGQTIGRDDAKALQLVAALLDHDLDDSARDTLVV